MKKLFLFLSLLYLAALYSQNTEEKINKIQQLLSEYYTLDRENIHVHFNKDIYFTDEQIWLNGYVYHQQNKSLFEATTNVFMELFDQDQALIEKKLLFCYKGVFQTNIKLKDNMPSGKYYLRFYTNYMNNFSEDLSSTYEIMIVNSSDEGETMMNAVNLSNINITVHPESGVFLEGTPNTVGVKITDCYGKGIPVENVSVLDANNNQMMVFSSNKYGYAKFEITPENIDYRIEATVKGKVFSQNLPKVSSGISLSVISYLSDTKSLFKIKSININPNQKYYLIVNQNHQVVINEFVMDKEEIAFSMDNAMLFEGVNTARIVDENFNLLAERLFFLAPTNTKLSISEQNPNLDVAKVSISYLPEASKNLKTERNIFNSLLINPYTIENCNYDLSYFSERSRAKKYELDLFFLNQKSKTDWNALIAEQFPQMTHTFDIGIALKGKLNQTIKDKSKYKVVLFSLEAKLYEAASIDENNEFEFHNLVLADSMWVNFSLRNEKNKEIPLKTYVRILDNYKSFNKPVNIPDKPDCLPEQTFSQEAIDIPKFHKNHILLNTVQVESELPRLSRERRNPTLKGFKVDDLSTGVKVRMVVDFLESQGFYVVRSTTETAIYTSRHPISLNSGLSSPALFIDDVEQMSFTYISTLRMDDIDEIYLDKYAIVPSINNKAGVIKIYLKTGGRNQSGQDLSSHFQIKGGFSRKYEFEHADYSMFEKGFQYYGALYWQPEAVSTDQKQLQPKTNYPNQENAIRHIEGVSSEGRLISEVQTIPLK
jgi:hypothetical protein